MTTHYLFDAHTSPIADSQINDVRFAPPANTSPFNGSFIVPIGDTLDVPPETVTGLNDLLTKKYQETLVSYPGFSNIVYDDLLDPTGIDTVNSYGALLGDRGSIALGPTAFAGPPVPLIQTAMVVLGGTPAEAVVAWEVFHVSRADPRVGRMVRSYVEADPAELTVAVSFDNGANFNLVTEGSLFNIPPADQGNQLILALEPTIGPPVNRLYLGSWAVIY